MKKSYISAIGALLVLIDKPNRSACAKILKDNWLLFCQARGSSHNHHSWPGGYYDHILDTMNIAVTLYPIMNGLRSLPFSLSDALLIIFLHDIEKPWKYRPDGQGEIEYVDELKTKRDVLEFQEKKLTEYGIVLTPEQENGLRYVEGEYYVKDQYKVYSNKQRSMNPLAAFCHMCDVASARVWFDRPAAKNEEWSPLGRITQK